MRNRIGDAADVFTERVPSRHEHCCPGTVARQQPINCYAPLADTDGRLTAMIYGDTAEFGLGSKADLRVIYASGIPFVLRCPREQRS